jgi:hypothetical protein
MLLARTGVGYSMEEVHILLYRNHSHKDWSLNIGGIIHAHISTATVDDLIDYASLLAQHNLLALEGPECVPCRSAHLN